MMDPVWSESRVRMLRDQGGPEYQKIELPYGLSTRGRHDRSSTADKIFPDDMTGKSVLDVGCKLGYFGFEALRRGAERVVGIDVDPACIRKARQLADCLGLDATFEQRDVEAEPIHDSFDYVLCLNVLHHVRDPIATLHRLTSITRECLALEVAGLRRRDRQRAGLSRLASRYLARLPIMVVNRSDQFFITPFALTRILESTHAFERVETVSSEHKRRYITTALKSGSRPGADGLR